MLNDTIGNVGGPKVIKGTTAMWAVMNEVIPLGVFALEILTNNTVRLKIGNNVNKFSELPYLADDFTLSSIGRWEPNVPYPKNTLVMYGGGLMLSMADIPADTVFNQELWKPISTEETESRIESKLSKIDANRNLVDNIIVTNSPTAVNLNVNKYNLNQKTSGIDTISLPLADGANAGIMPPSAVRAIADNTSRIQAIEGRVSFFLVDFSSMSNSSNPTQEDFLNVFKVASGLEVPFDGATLVNQADTSVRYRYYTNASIWKLDSTGGVGIASNTSLGIVCGSEEKGQIYIEADGSMSLVGYNDIIGGKKYNSCGISTGTSENETLPFLTKAKVISDPEVTTTESSDTPQLLSLQVLENGEPNTNVKGFEINGMRMDFEADKLSIRTAQEKDTYNLEKGPYTITSPYATVELYGNLILFDEVVPGKGIIRKPDGKILEVTDLGVFAPSSKINVIHIMGYNDEEVCYILSFQNGKDVLIFYPDGTYKTLVLPDIKYNPMSVPDTEILTSVDGTRHSLFMYNSHPLGQANSTPPTFYALLQLESATFKVVDNTSPSIDPLDTTASPNMSFNFGNTRKSWEADVYANDLELDSKYHIDTTRANSLDLNKRFKFRTGQWNTLSGSVMKHRPLNEIKNGLHRPCIGAQFLWDAFTTCPQVLIVTPEGFLGWTAFSVTLSSYVNVMWREIPIRNGKYKGKTGLLFFSEDVGTKFLFFVNTPDGNPDHTLCKMLHTDLNNQFLSCSLSNHQVAFNFRPDRIYSDLNRIYFHQSDQSSNSSLRYGIYINFSDMPGVCIDRKVEDSDWSSLIEGKFDFHILDTSLDSSTNKTTLNFYPADWQFIEDIDFGTPTIPYKGTLVKSSSPGNVDMFYPSTKDEYTRTLDGVITGFTNRPYFIERPGDTTDLQTFKNERSSRFCNYHHSCATWHKHHFQCLAIHSYKSGNTNYANQALDYYLNPDTNKVVCKGITFATPGFIGLPVIIDDKVMLLWNYDGSARCVGLIWKGDITGTRPSTNDDYTVMQGGNWLPPRGVTDGGVIYIDLSSHSSGGYMDEEGEENALIVHDSVTGRTNPVAYFFDPSTVRQDYIGFSYSYTPAQAPDIMEVTLDLLPPEGTYTKLEDISFPDGTAGAKIQMNETSEIIEPRWATYQLPRTMKVGGLIAYTGKKALLLTEGNDTLASYITVGTGQAIAIMYPDNCHLQDVYDITNVNNPNESPDCAYAIFTSKSGYFYVAERDSITGIPQLTKYSVKTKNHRKIWSLPHGEISVGENKIPTMRFAVGCFETNSVGSSEQNYPFTIIDRVGGTIINDTNPVGFTQVREFRGSLNDTPISYPTRWTEPGLVYEAKEISSDDQEAFDNPVITLNEVPMVRFIEGGRWFDPASTDVTLNSTERLLGYDDDGNPCYGNFNFMPNADHGNYNYSEKYNFNCRGILEIGQMPEDDSYTNFVSSGNSSYTNSIQVESKLPVDVMEWLGQQGIDVTNNPPDKVYLRHCTVWATKVATAASNHNFFYLSLNNWCIVVPVKNSFINSTGTEFAPKKYPIYALVREYMKGSSSIVPHGVDTVKGGDTFSFKARRNVFAARSLSRQNNASINNPPIVTLLLEEFFRRIDTTGALAKSDIANNRNNIIPAMQIEATTPLHDLYTNIILPGITRRRNNADINTYSLTTSEGKIPPYLAITDNTVDLVYAQASNAPIDGVTPFYDEVMVCHPREGLGSNQLFMTRHKYELSGDALIGCFWINQLLNNRATFKEIKVQNAGEIITRITYTNEKMQIYAMSKCWTISLGGNEFQVTKKDEVPLAAAVVSFDLNLDIATWRDDDNYNLHLYIPQTLVVIYKGKEVCVINMKDLILRGQTMSEYLSVINTLSTNLLEANSVIAQLISINKAVIQDLENTKAVIKDLTAKKVEIEYAHITRMDVDSVNAKELLLVSQYPSITY